MSVALEDQLISVLGWSTPIPALASLAAALRGSEAKLDLSVPTALCFDSNVFINLGKGAKGAELIDYLGGKHQGPIVLPMQVVVELWNNHLRSVQTFANKLSKQFQDLNSSIREIEPQYEALREGATRLADSFESEYGHLFDQKTRTELITLVDVLSSKGTFSQVDRQRFAQVANSRKRTRTPPGFEDGGDGDFFVWAELLLGVMQARVDGVAFDQLVLVTDDVKKDWSTNGTPHPILCAEVEALFEVPFHVAKLSEFRDAVQQSLR